MNRQTLLNLLGAGTIGLSLTAGAADTHKPQAGKLMSRQDMSNIAGNPSVTVGSQTYKVLRGSTTDSKTLVVNDQGLVGESGNEVLISQVPTSTVRANLARLNLAAISIKYYDHVNTTVLRFATFEEAAWARNQIKSVLPPEASVGVPVQYGKLQPR
ncbi:MAG: hypothetical protein NVS3B5_22690 [Sphingomicrobium sp.]